MFYIEKVENDKNRYLDLLLLADPSEDLIREYLPNGEMFVLFENNTVIGQCVVVERCKGECELKNISVKEQYQRRGHGKRLIAFICNYYKKKYQTMFVGTGEVPKAILFYESCGFQRSHVLENFFVDNYKEPVIDDGVCLIDMIYLKKYL